MLRRVGLGHELPDPAVWITNLLSPKGGGGDQWAVKKPSPSVSVCEYCTSHTETSLSPSDTLTVALGSGQQRETTNIWTWVTVVGVCFPAREPEVAHAYDSSNHTTHDTDRTSGIWGHDET